MVESLYCEIYPPRCYVILGSKGAGKSTFINSMLGINAVTGEGMLAVTHFPTPHEKNGLTLIDCPGDSDPK